MFQNLFLNFSDTAKFADVARNMVSGLGYGAKFNFWSGDIFNLIKTGLFPSPDISPVTPLSIAFLFKIFGISDFAVVATSFFYFLLTLIFVFLLAKKLYKSNLIASLSLLAVAFNYDLIHYATGGASESPFIFEIVAGFYFLSLKKRWATFLGFAFMALLYFTRQQAFIYIAGLILFYLLDRFKIKKALVFFCAAILLGILVDRYVLAPLSGMDFIYSIVSRSQGVVTQNLPGTAISDSLRGSSPVSLPSHLSVYIDTFKKIFYNLYNFYKLLPQIINPYIFALFLIGLFKWGKDKIQNSFKVASAFMVVVTLLVTAASIPFFRYIHPIIPFVYIIAVGTLVEILSYQFTKKSHLILASVALVIFFAVGQTLGIFLLDSRFVADTHNVGKPPVYVLLSYKLRDSTNKNDVVLTNLDTWGSWYGERKTVWFPLEPKQIIDPTTGKIPFDAIYLTSYLIDDQNYYMGADWREIFLNPTDSKKWTCDGCSEIAKEYKLKQIIKIGASENYERQDASAILFIKK